MDKRNLVFLLLVIGVIFSLFSTNWIEAEIALKAICRQTARPARVWTLWSAVHHLWHSPSDGGERIHISAIWEDLKQIPGVQSVDYDQDDDLQCFGAV